MVAGERTTRNQILAYAALLVPIALAPAFTQVGGPLYLAVAVALNARFLWLALKVRLRSQGAAASDGYRAEKKLFGVSIVYLFAHFAALFAEALLRAVFGDYAAGLALF